MLRYFYDNDLVNILAYQPKDWEEAIRCSGEGLLKQALITERYIDDVIRDVHQYGPYIVIIPQVAMPHSSAESEGVIGTGIGFTILPQAVSFESGNSEKDAKLFFMLAANDPDAHMKNISNLSEMLMIEGLVDDLLQVKTMNEYKLVMQKYEEQGGKV